MKQEERIHGVFIFILLVLFIAYEEILRVIPQFIKKELFESIKLSPDSLGLMGTFALYVYLILQIPIGYIYDRITMRLVIPLVVFICALGAFFFGWSYNLFFATFAKGLMSFSLPFAFIGSMMVILRWFPHQRFALLVGTAQLIGALGHSHCRGSYRDAPKILHLLAGSDDYARLCGSCFSPHVSHDCQGWS